MRTAALRAARAPGRSAPLLLLAPAAAVAAAALLPLVYLVVRAASADRGAWDVLEPGTTGRLVVDTGVLVVAVVAATLAIGVPLAWLVTRTDLPARRAWAVAAALPLVIPSYVAALALLGALGPRGLLQGFLERPFGVERLPEIYGLPGAVLALTLSTYPYVYLLAAAALRSMDPGLEEAARGLGRSPLAAFVQVTVPALRPAVGAGALLVALYTISDFGVVSLMQYPALTRAIYLQYQALFDRDPAIVLALVLVALTALVLVGETLFRRRARYHRSQPGVRRAPAIVPLGRWRWPAAGFCALVVGCFLALPLGVLVHWAAQGIELGRPLDVAWQAGANSLLAAVAAAAVAGAAAVPVAVAARRGAWGRGLERLALVGNALPGIVVALSLVFFGANYAGWAYQTLALLVFAYVVRFLPQAIAATGASLRTVDPRLEEAARGLGRSGMRAFVAVTLPLVRRGVLAGAALVFLSTMKELPATLLLKPIGFDTLATEIWSETSVAAYSAAAPSALLLVVLSTPFVWLLTVRGRGFEAAG
jgi:iron(III) transport system permease protein